MEIYISEVFKMYLKFVQYLFVKEDLKCLQKVSVMLVKSVVVVFIQVVSLIL